MVKVDLITGFLGAGKTTFLKGYIDYLKRNNVNIHLIENEFGETSIDSKILNNELHDDCEISDLSGMCMCCVGKSEFIRLLMQSASQDCDRIIVEPSGIYDVDEFFEVMTNPRVSEVCEIGSVITIVDPFTKTDISNEARYLMFSQLLASGIVVISKTQLVDESGISETINNLNELMIEKGCEQGLLVDVVTKDWSAFSDDDYEEIQDCGYLRAVHDREEFVHAAIFQSMQYKGAFDSKQDLITKIQGLFANEELGEIYRVKGYAKTLSGEQYEVNCTGSLIYVEPTNIEDSGLVIIGRLIREKAIINKLKINTKEL